MDYLLDERILKIFIISVVGIFGGFANYLNSPLLNNKEKRSSSNFIDHFQSITQFCITGCVIAFISYSLLDTTETSFTFKCGVAALASYLGLDKCIEIAEKFTRFKK